MLKAPETLAAGCADQVGKCYGFTTPSITGVAVVGSGAEDKALSVTFDDGTSVWIAPSLVVVIDVGAGQTATVGDRRLVRLPTGEWVDAADSD